MNTGLPTAIPVENVEALSSAIRANRARQYRVLEQIIVAAQSGDVELVKVLAENI